MILLAVFSLNLPRQIPRNDDLADEIVQDLSIGFAYNQSAFNFDG